jgi:L-amino acid N-acyltransferase YncA
MIAPMERALADGRLLRPARPADLDGIVAIYNASIPGRLATADTEPVTVASRRAWFEEHDDSRRPLWVLDDAGAIDAWLSFSDFYGRPAYGATAELSVYVAPARHRLGDGRLLLDAAMERAPALGLEVVLAFVFGHNEASLRLFASRGFEQWAWLPGVARLDGNPTDLAILGRRVTT